MSALEEAVRLDPGDRQGGTAILLGKVCFQRQQWEDAARHFTAALSKVPGDSAIRELLHDAECNRESDIGPPMMVASIYDRAAMLQPPAMHLRTPEIQRPAPFNAGAPSHISKAWSRFQELVGMLGGAGVSFSIWI